MKMQIVHVVVLTEALRVLVWCRREPDKYLFISSPVDEKVSFARLPAAKPMFGRSAPKWVVENLVQLPLGESPAGLAVDQKRQILYVAVPAKMVVKGYYIQFQDGKAQVKGDSFVAVKDVKTWWVACDGVGSVFVTDEEGGQILKVPARDLVNHNSTAKVIYDKDTILKVSNPAGIAVDNFHAYWGNKALGTQQGSVVKAFEEPVNEEPNPESVRSIATNLDQVHGVCLVHDIVFFSAPETSLYATDKKGLAEATVVDNSFHSPRGCSWDGDGTVFVADYGANAVLSFAGNMNTPDTARVSKLVDVKAPFDVAVMSGAGINALALNTLLVAMMSSVCG